MDFNDTEYNVYLYDGHGHSNASDGLHKPEHIIDSAVHKGLSIIGLSDHNVVSNIPRFLDYTDKINKHKHIILPIPAVEISTTQGDLLVTIPDRDHAENFLTKYKKPQRRPNPSELIEEYIDQYNAIIIFPHPEVAYLKGLKLDYIEKLLHKIPQPYHKNIGIEVYNWMSQAFFWKRAKQEKGIHNYNKALKLSPFSFTDYHQAHHVGNGSTAVYMKDLTAKEYINAVQNRRTSPYNTSNRGISEYMQIVKAALIAEGLTHFGNRQFRVPKSHN
ncbi:MAG: PHP domain-containing protein [bacterium]|nr:PHP domain-containing protein [bacterium]